MKKLFLLSFFVVLTLTVSAQTNTYAMVIEMQNGSKLTIGPNEVKNVTFNNGQLTVTGETIETLVASAVNEAKDYTDQATANLKGYIDLATQLANLEGRAADKADVAALQKANDLAHQELVNSIAALSNKTSTDLASAVQGIDANIAAAVKLISDNTTAIYSLTQTVQANKDAQDNIYKAAQNYALDQIKNQADLDKSAWNAAINIAVQTLVQTYRLNAMDEIISSRINQAIVNLIQTYNLQKP